MVAITAPPPATTSLSRHHQTLVQTTAMAADRRITNRQVQSQAHMAPRTLLHRRHRIKGTTTVAAMTLATTPPTTPKPIRNHLGTPTRQTTTSSHRPAATISPLHLHQQATAKVHHLRAATAVPRSPSNSVHPPSHHHHETQTTATPSGRSSCKSTKIAQVSSPRTSCEER